VEVPLGASAFDRFWWNEQLSGSLHAVVRGRRRWHYFEGDPYVKNGIMVPLDGTLFSEAALPFAIELAERDDVPLELVTVWQPLPKSYMATQYVVPLDRELRAERQSYLERLADTVEKSTSAKVSVRYLEGWPGDVLPPLPRESGQDLVVMATHGAGALQRMWLGSIADEMARKSSTPVLLIRPSDPIEPVALKRDRPVRRVLVPLDGSPLAERALDRSILVGRGEGVELTLLHVIAFPPPIGFAGVNIADTPDAQMLRTEERQAAQAYLDRVAEQVATWAGSVRTVVLDGVVSRQAILAFAESEQIDLIAMASRGRSGAKRLILGSVAAGVVRGSTVPVLLFHPEHDAGDASYLVD
jgi:nucleotide-binding universal stress UspA family protein